MRWTWPWPRPRTNPRLQTPPERKQTGGFVALHVGGEAHWTRRNYAGLAREGYMSNPVAHRAVKLVAEAVAGLPLLAYEDGRERPDHPALALMARPNARQSAAEFLETLHGHLLIAGNAYVEMSSGLHGSTELHLLRPDQVTVACDVAGWPAALDYQAASTRRRIPLGPEGTALHLALFNPLDEHRGFPPLEAAMAALDTHNAAAGWNKALLDNSARPSGALVYAPKDGGSLTEEQFDRLRAELDNNSGKARAGRPLLLDGGLDWKAMGLTPRDMDFMEARNGAARDIALALGVPPMLLGIPGDATYANYAEANRSFFRLTVLPMAGRTLAALSSLLDRSGRLKLWYDPDAIGALAPEREALWQRVSAASFLTEDEKREAVGYGRGSAEEKGQFRRDRPRVPREGAFGGQSPASHRDGAAES
jgi:HK97 family phage portal protein